MLRSELKSSVNATKELMALESEIRRYTVLILKSKLISTARLSGHRLTTFTACRESRLGQATHRLTATESELQLSNLFTPLIMREYDTQSHNIGSV